MLRQAVPDLVLLDIVMPGIDGLRGLPADPRRTRRPRSCRS